MSLVAMFQKQKVSNSKKAFSCDHFGLMWNQASEEHKRLLLRAAFLQENQSRNRGELIADKKKAPCIHSGCGLKNLPISNE